MALLEESLGGNLLTAAMLVTGAFLLNRLAPELPPDLRSIGLSGLKLFAEAEFEAQDGIITKLAENAVEALLQTMPLGRSPAGMEKASRIVRNFDQNARERSRRGSWHEADKKARYRHHVRRLKMAVADAERGMTAQQQEWMAQAIGGISEDW